MEAISHKINDLDWDLAAKSMHHNGYVVLPELLPDAVCEKLKSLYYRADLYRKTVEMTRYRFGQGEYKYFDYPLPDLIGQVRSEFYGHLAPIANSWFQALHINTQFPAKHGALLETCRQNGQMQATPLILQYGPGGFNTLHQDLYGNIYFPMQVVLMLSAPDRDYTGGEFVLMQQMPRAQSKVTVLRPKKGDAVIFTTNFKPEKGARGYYRVNIKHGVSEVIQGQRYTLGLIFHDAKN